MVVVAFFSFISIARCEKEGGEKGVSGGGKWKWLGLVLPYRFLYLYACYDFPGALFDGVFSLDTGVGGLVLSEQFLQLSTKLPSSHLYGLGEHSRHTFRRQFQTHNSWPAFARDQPPGVGATYFTHYTYRRFCDPGLERCV